MSSRHISLSKLNKCSSPTHALIDPLISLQNLSISGNVDDATMVEQDGQFLNDAITGPGDAFSDKDHDGDDSSSSGNESSDHDDGFSPASPINIPDGTTRKSSGLTMRDSLLADAWKRKKELALQDELSNLKEYAMPHLLGRSSSDCGAAASMRNHHDLLNRSASDVGKNSCPVLSRTRTRSLTDDDFEELKGFIDLGFRFDETSLPAFSHTLPALEVYCAVAQSLQESPYCLSLAASPARFYGSAPSTPSWRVCSPGDAPEDVKGRLRHWAQAVACNVRFCY